MSELAFQASEIVEVELLVVLRLAGTEGGLVSGGVVPELEPVYSSAPASQAELWGRVSPSISVAGQPPTTVIGTKLYGVAEEELRCKSKPGPWAAFT